MKDFCTSVTLVGMCLGTATMAIGGVNYDNFAFWCGVATIVINGFSHFLWSSRP